MESNQDIFNSNSKRETYTSRQTWSDGHTVKEVDEDHLDADRWTNPQAWEAINGSLLSALEETSQSESDKHNKGEGSRKGGKKEGGVRGGGVFGALFGPGSSGAADIALPPGSYDAGRGWEGSAELEQYGAETDRRRQLSGGSSNKNSSSNGTSAVNVPATGAVIPNRGSSVSAFLGDELSVHHANFFGTMFGALGSAQHAQPPPAPSRARPPPPRGWSPPTPRPSHAETGPLLQPLVDVTAWRDSTRYWVLPTVVAGFPPPLLTETRGGWPTSPLSTSGPIDWFTCHELGCGVVNRAPAENNINSAPAEARWLLLRQNFLFEYPTSDTKGPPLGFLPLHRATVSRKDPSDPFSVAITALAEPAADARRIALKIRAPTVGIGERWLDVLSQAAALEVESLYEFVQAPRDWGSDASLAGSRPTSPQRGGSMSPSRDGAGGHKAILEPTELGRGRFSTVRRGRRKAGTGAGGGCVCALKLVNKATFTARVAEGKERIDTLVREVLSQAVLSAHCTAEDAQNPAGRSNSDASNRCSHGCFMVHLLSVFETVDTLALEMELMSGIDLFDKLSSTGVMSEREAAGLVSNVLHAASFCIEHGFAHRDIKLSNLLYPADASHLSDPSNVKLADFGMAGKVGADGLLYGRCGTPGYVAPEILHAKVSEGYPMNVDAFSVGVVAYTVLCGYEPLYGVNEQQLIAANKIASYEFHMPEWSQIPEDAKDLVRRLLEIDPHKRLTPEQALEHPWLQRCKKQSAQAPLASVHHHDNHTGGCSIM